MTARSAPWRCVLRLARRELARAKGRSLLVAAMVGIPVMLIAGFVVAGTTISSSTTPEQSALRAIGSADALIVADGRAPVRQEDATGLQVASTDDEVEDVAGEGPWAVEEIAEVVGGRVVAVHRGSALIETDHGARTVPARALDITDPLVDGQAELVDGRAPRSPDEVMVSPALAGDGHPIGSTLDMTDPGRPVSVVGIARDPNALTEAAIFTTVDGALAAREESDPAATVFLVGASEPVRWADVERLNKLGLIVQSRTVLHDPPPVATDETVAPTQGTEQLLFAFVVACIVLEVALLAGPAFVVGARQRRRDFAQLAAVGGSARDIRRVMLLHASLLGVCAAVLGATIGVGGVLLAQPWLERLAGVTFTSWQIPPLYVGLTMGVGVFAVFAAAIVPAAQAARQDIVAGLAGRGSVRTARGWPTIGALAAAGGGALVFSGATRSGGGEALVAGGTLLLVTGVVLAMPALIGTFGRVAHRLPPALRMATRDATRHRARSASAVAAIMGAVCGVTALAIGSYSDHAEARRDYVPLEPMGMLRVELSGIETADAQRLADDIDREIAGERPIVVEGSAHSDAGSTRWAMLAAPGCDPAQLGAGTWDADDVPCESYRLPASTDPDPVAVDVEAWIDLDRDILVADLEGIEALLQAPLTSREREILRFGGVLVPTSTVLDDDPNESETGEPAAGADGDKADRDRADGDELIGRVRILTHGEYLEDENGGYGPTDIEEHWLAAAVRDDLVDTQTRTISAVVIEDTEGAPTAGERSFSEVGTKRAMAGIVLTTATAEERLGLQLSAQQILVPPGDSGRISRDTEARIAELATAAVSEPTWVYVERGFTTSYTPILAILIAVGGLIVLVGTVTATSLALSDARSDLATLQAIGASPWMRRRQAMAQAAVIGFLGAGIGTLVGIVPGIAVTVPLTANGPGGHIIAIPWLALGLVIIAVPTLAILSTGLFTRNRLPVARRLI